MEDNRNKVGTEQEKEGDKSTYIHYHHLDEGDGDCLYLYCDFYCGLYHIKLERITPNYLLIP